jgi:two-component system sensor histidine kinase BaeS
MLARSLGAPLLHLTEAVARFSPEKSPEFLPEQGPDELKTLAITFNRQSRHLYELERTRKILLSGIVHELGRPLGSIKTAAQTIQHNEDRMLCAELAGGISDQIDQLRLQIDDLALLGELEVQGLLLNCEPVDLGELVEGQCRQFARLAAHQGLTLTCQLPAMLPLIVADPQRIGQVLSNLLNNACKYTPAGGHIQVLATVDSGQDGADAVLISVADDGLGIALSEQESIFQLFYRSPSQRRIHEGMGIGLALARQLVEAHGGSLEVVSLPGQGATFCLRLPIGQSNPRLNHA